MVKISALSFISYVILGKLFNSYITLFTIWYKTEDLYKYWWIRAYLNRKVRDQWGKRRQSLRPEKQYILKVDLTFNLTYQLSVFKVWSLAESPQNICYKIRSLCQKSTMKLNTPFSLVIYLGRKTFLVKKAVP